MFLLKLLKFKHKAVFLRFLHGLANACVLLNQSTSLALELILHLFLVLAQLLVIIFLDLQLLSFFLLLQLFLEERNL